MSENVTITNPELKANLEALRIKESPALEQAIYEQICTDARFLSVARPAKDFTAENPKYDFPVLTTTSHGYMFYPIFTDMEELRKWNKDEDVQTAVLTLDDYVQMMEENPKVQGIVINPYGANFSIERDMVEFLKVQRAFIGKLTIEQMFNEQADTGPKVGDPEVYPEEMVRAMADYMATNATIRRAWLSQMENEGEKSCLVVIDARDSETEGDFGAVSGAALPFLKDLYLDFLPYEDAFAKKAVEGVAPFYEQK